MKMRSLRTLAFGITMAIMASSTAGFADIDSSDRGHSISDGPNCINRRRVEELSNRFRIDLVTRFASLNNIFTYLGASSNPNPTTNPAVAGIIAADVARSAAAGVDALAVLAKLGVPPAVLDIISTQSTAFFDAALTYAIDVNLANTGQPSGDQFADAIVVLNTANALGTTLFALTGDPQFVGLLTTIGNLLTQSAQAYRGVLEDANAFGAAPSDPASETAAAVEINEQILRLASRIARTLIFELADKQCSSRLFSS